MLEVSRVSRARRGNPISRSGRAERGGASFKEGNYRFLLARTKEQKNRERNQSLKNGNCKLTRRKGARPGREQRGTISKEGTDGAERGRKKKKDAIELTNERGAGGPLFSRDHQRRRRRA